MIAKHILVAMLELVQHPVLLLIKQIIQNVPTLLEGYVILGSVWHQHVVQMMIVMILFLVQQTLVLILESTMLIVQILQ